MLQENNRHKDILNTPKILFARTVLQDQDLYAVAAVRGRRQVALQYREVIDTMVADKNNKLRKYELNDLKWITISDLHRILKMRPIDFAFLCTNTFTALQGVDTEILLRGCGHHRSRPSPAIKLALLLQGQKIMNKYYAKSDDSHTYHIAMILHSGFKTKYFKHYSWEQEWIDEAIYIYVAEADLAEAEANSNTGNSSEVSVDVTDFFDISLAPDHQGENCKLLDYLSQPIEGTTDLLQWWYDHKSCSVLDGAGLPQYSYYIYCC
ncbi:hypothetical protein B0H16DRAFT_1800028 [Mycena metata]|uniref:Uncharacterized protein n=1 Tax=Mycena metata TaxID=1033252 RepID=A0AAD7HBU6_9AGAR|nr:hypothetical protein B0H16DRAFT_1800028 [Mycena metata]